MSEQSNFGGLRMDGILIQYELNGDVQAWRHAVDAFIDNVQADDRLRGRFSYQVKQVGDGAERIHIGTWDSAETLAHLQAQEFFKIFAGQVQGFAGDSLKTTRFSHVTGTI